MREALATWHMGRVICAYRTHPFHRRPLSQQVVGGWLGLTQAQLSRIENGRAPEELTKLIRYAQILGIPERALWFALPGQPAGSRAAEPDPPDTLRLPAVVNGRLVTLPVDRTAASEQGLDDLLAGLAAETQNPAAGEGASRADSPGMTGAVTVLGPDEPDHVAAALDDARRYLDGSVVSFFYRKLDRCKADDGSVGPARTLPLVLGILGALARHVREVRPDVRLQLLSLGADGAEFAGWLCRDLRDPAGGAYWYDRAMEWAQEAGDTSMQGYVLLKKSQMAYDHGDAFRVVTLARAAAQGPWHLTGKVRAEVSQSEALGMAMLGEPLRAVERKLAEASGFLAAVPDDDGAGPAGAYITADTLLLRQAACYVEAGKPARAAQMFADVLRRGELSHRDAGFFRARRAAALALSGEPDEAAAVGLQALRVAQETSSERTIRVLADAATALAPWRSRPGPGALRSALATRSR